MTTGTKWSTTFVAELAAARDDTEGRRALEDLRAAVAAARTRKGPPTFACEPPESPEPPVSK